MEIQNLSLKLVTEEIRYREPRVNSEKHYDTHYIFGGESILLYEPW